jgi:hypothetical protein
MIRLVHVVTFHELLTLYSYLVMSLAPLSESFCSRTTRAGPAMPPRKVATLNFVSDTVLAEGCRPALASVLTVQTSGDS